MGADGGLAWIVPRGRTDAERMATRDKLLDLLEPWVGSLTRDLPRVGETPAYYELSHELDASYIEGPYGDFIGDDPVIDQIQAFAEHVENAAKVGSYDTFEEYLLDLDSIPQWQRDNEREAFPYWNRELRSAPEDFLARNITAWCRDLCGCIVRIDKQETWT